METEGDPVRWWTLLWFGVEVSPLLLLWYPSHKFRREVFERVTFYDPIQNSQRPLLLHKKPRVNILLPSIQLHPDLWLHRSWTATPSPDWTSSVVTEPESHPRHSPTGSYLVFLVSFHQLDRKSDWGRSTIDWGIAAIEVARGLPGSIFLIVTQCRTQSTVGGIISALVDLGCKLKITEQANLSASSLPGFCFSSYLCVPAWVPALNDEHARMDM